MILEQESRVSDPQPFHADPDPGFVKMPLRIQGFFSKNLCFNSKNVRKECWTRIKMQSGYRDTKNVDLMPNRIRNAARRNTASICFFRLSAFLNTECDWFFLLVDTVTTLDSVSHPGRALDLSTVSRSTLTGSTWMDQQQAGRHFLLSYIPVVEFIQRKTLWLHVEFRQT